jgi:ribonuclease E
MAKRMLIDATHPEETRVVVLDGNRLDEFDFESSTKKQIKGNIYLAKVTRVEPSLQAAFVDFGGNRHGFLAFSEIHPDYYRIPVGDRGPYRDREPEYTDHPAPETHRDHNGFSGNGSPAQIQDNSAAPFAPQSDEQPAVPPEAWGAPSEPPGSGEVAPPQGERQPEHDFASSLSPDAGSFDDAQAHAADNAVEPGEERHDTPVASETGQRALAERSADDTLTARSSDYGDADGTSFGEGRSDDRAAEFEGERQHPMSDAESAQSFAGGESERSPEGNDSERPAGDSRARAEPAQEPQGLDTLGGDDFEEAARHRSRSLRHYKIQEVVKRRQIMLVQVTKEERGNKGAALTTYLSLAGRYCVLMPNTGRGGGVSRKITSVADRRRLKELLEDLDLPEGMGVIVRTAGSERSKAEIKRDLEYLLRLWDEIRSLTLQSTAPALIYEEGNLIKRSIRDLYARDIDEVLVEGEEGYRTAKAFMKMLMPSHAKRVQPYRDPSIPLLHRFQVETQIDLIHSPVVQLRSGGYIVISPTEALVAIDVNSGRSTKERNIEETATRTNLEAAEEIARQLRLRDLAGLIVIDFIDMEEHRNQGAVERRLKDAMKHDRARIQVGRISPFGLLELSRQRLRPSLVEASTQPCPHCNGTGHIRSTESTALHVLRAIEEEGIRRRSAELCIYVPTAIALYILNQKRVALTQIETRYGFRVAVSHDDTLIPPAFRLERLRALTPAEAAVIPAALTHLPPPIEDDDDEDIEETEETAEQSAPAPTVESGGESGGGEEEHGRRRRRKRRRRRPGEENEPSATADFARTGEPLPHAAEPFEGDEPDDMAAPEGELAPETQAEMTGAPNRPMDGGEAGGERKRRRRGKRGGRRRGRSEGPAPVGSEDANRAFEPSHDVAAESVEIVHQPVTDEHDGEFRRDLETAFTAVPLADGDETIDIAEAPVAEASEPMRRRRPPRSRRSETDDLDLVAEAPAALEPQQSYAPASEERVAGSLQPAHASASEEVERIPVPAHEASTVAADLETTHEVASGNKPAGGSLLPEPKLVTEKPANPKRGWWQRLLEP